MSKIIPSQRQLDIYDAVKRGVKNLVVVATAGSGKTTTLVNSFPYMQGEILNIAFANNTVNTLVRKIEEVFDLSGDFDAKAKRFKSLPVTVKTSNSTGAGLLYSAGFKYRPVLLDGADVPISKQKYYAAVKNVGYQFEKQASMVKLINEIRMNLILDEAELKSFFDEYDTDVLTYSDARIALQLVKDNSKDARYIDFLDQLYLPVVFGLKPKTYPDWICVDECQDLSSLQRKILMTHIGPNTHTFWVGDPEQAMFLFAGAALNSIELIKKELKEFSGEDPVQLPLDICYRCATDIVKEAQKGNDFIKPFEGQIKGVVRYIENEQLLSQLELGDTVLSRTNAPLLKLAFQLIGAGMKVTVRGRDFSSNLINFVKKYVSQDSADFCSDLNYNARAAASKELSKEENRKYELILDKLACCNAICEMNDVNSFKDFERIVKDIFSDAKSPITLSVIHRVKGDEFPRVFVLNYEQVGVPWKPIEKEILGEKAVLFVCRTRAQIELVYVKSPLKEIK